MVLHFPILVSGIVAYPVLQSFSRAFLRAACSARACSGCFISVLVSAIFGLIARPNNLLCSFSYCLFSRFCHSRPTIWFPPFRSRPISVPSHRTRRRDVSHSATTATPDMQGFVLDYVNAISQANSEAKKQGRLVFDVDLSPGKPIDRLTSAAQDQRRDRCHA